LLQNYKTLSISIKMKKRLFLSVIALASITATYSQNNTIQLLDANLTNFNTYIGVPHSTVVGLPEDTYQSDNVRKGTPLGLNKNRDWTEERTLGFYTIVMAILVAFGILGKPVWNSRCRKQTLAILFP